MRLRLIMPFHGQKLYPETAGVAPPTSKPIIVLIVRETKRMLGNNDQVGALVSWIIIDFKSCPFQGP